MQRTIDNRRRRLHRRSFMDIDEPTTAKSTALLTDHYELTMLRAALADGVASNRAVFEVFARELPPGRPYGVAAGLERVLDAITAFRFTSEQIEFLQANEVVDARTARYLRTFRFGGDISAYPEGEAYQPGSPVLTVDGSFGECVLLETLVLSILNHDSAIAAAASRMVVAAGGRTLIEMGARRTHEDAAIAAARAAYLVGFDATSDLAAGLRYGVPTAGTVAHSFVLAHRDEQAAFASQVAALGTDTTVLVDSYDVPAAIAKAVRVAGTRLGAIRLDSGDIAAQARAARMQLDALGATTTRIVASGDLDEFRIADLADAPVDAYGVGTSLVTGSGHPTAGFIYKLVAIADGPDADAPLRPVAKRSEGKATTGGRKVAYRSFDETGHADGEQLVTDAMTAEAKGTRLRALQVPAMVAGRVVHRPSLDEIRMHHRDVLVEIGP